VEVRRARPDDAAAVEAIRVRGWQAGYAHVFGAERLAALDPGRRVDGWRALIEDGHQACFVAEEGGRVVGWTTSAPSSGDAAVGELWGLYVDPEAWGSGAAAALLAASVDALRGRGFTEAVLWVLEDNPRARRFYEREGWTADGARKEEEFLGVVVTEIRFRRRL
jgi:ribosomal protein S18 acetylase RimI-like enzyme